MNIKKQEKKITKENKKSYNLLTITIHYKLQLLIFKLPNLKLVKR